MSIMELLTRNKIRGLPKEELYLLLSERSVSDIHAHYLQLHSHTPKIIPYISGISEGPETLDLFAAKILFNFISNIKGKKEAYTDFKQWHDFTESLTPDHYASFQSSILTLDEMLDFNNIKNVSDHLNKVSRHSKKGFRLGLSLITLIEKQNLPVILNLNNESAEFWVEHGGLSVGRIDKTGLGPKLKRHALSDDLGI